MGEPVGQRSPVAIGEVLVDKYRVDRVLGEGGMGIVVAAHHLELDQPVAIKFLLDALRGNEEGAERFRREARAAAKIQSDHVVRVLDVGVLESGVRFMVMEYLEGHDLSKELEQRGRLSTGQAIDYVLEALDAIAQAHAVGIVHRDLKPANLFLARRADGSSRIKVLDFGISKSLSGASSDQLSLTRSSAWVGSPLYMAPEQMQSARDVDERADIWSLGAILYELITGRPPYLAESLPQLCNLLLTTEPAPLSSLQPDVPAGVERVVLRCLERDLSARWQSVSELTAALRDCRPERTSTAATSSSALAATELQGTEGSGAQSATPSGGERAAARTQGAWGHTHPTSQSKRGIAWIGAVALGSALVLGALVVLLPAGGDEQAKTNGAAPAGSELPQESPPSSRSGPSSRSEEEAKGDSTAAPASQDPVEARDSPTTEPPDSDARPEQPSAAPASTDAVKSAPSASALSQPAKQSPPTAASRPARPKAPPAATATPRPAPTGGISDFGGRR